MNANSRGHQFSNCFGCWHMTVTHTSCPVNPRFVDTLKVILVVMRATSHCVCVTSLSTIKYRAPKLISHTHFKVKKILFNEWKKCFQTNVLLLELKTLFKQNLTLSLRCIFSFSKNTIFSKIKKDLYSEIAVISFNLSDEFQSQLRYPIDLKKLILKTRIITWLFSFDGSFMISWNNRGDKEVEICYFISWRLSIGMMSREDLI